MSKSTKKISFPKFSSNDTGLFFQADANSPARRIGDPLEIVSCFRYEGSNKQLIRYSFTDRSGKKVTGLILRSDLVKPMTVFAELVGAGWLPSTNDNVAPLIAKYFFQYSPKKVVTKTSRIGWRGKSFGWPGTVIEHDGERFKYFRSPYAHKINLDASGEPWEWEANVGAPCGYSHVLTFAICVSLAALVRRKLTKVPGGGFHFYGGSSKGKTTSLLVAHSVIGRPDSTGLFTWDATPTGLEETAIQHQDIVLCLDDTGNLTGTDRENANRVHDTAFRLSGRRSRTRSKQHGQRSENPINLPDGAPDVLYLSNGEASIRDIAHAGGKPRLAGSEVRLVDIPVGKLDSEWGIFDSLPKQFAKLDLPEQEKARLFAQSIVDGCERFFGSVGRHFTAAVSKKSKTAKESMDRNIKKFMDIPTGFDAATDRRIKERFAVAYAAGLLAVDLETLSLGFEEDVHAAVQWAYLAAMKDRYRPTGSVITGIQKMKEQIAMIATADTADIKTMLERFGGFTDPREKYKGVVLFRHEALVQLVGGEGAAKAVIDTLDKGGCLKHSAAVGMARTKIYKLGKERWRVLLVDVGQLQTL